MMAISHAVKPESFVVGSPAVLRAPAAHRRPVQVQLNI